MLKPYELIKDLTLRIIGFLVFIVAMSKHNGIKVIKKKQVNAPFILVIVDTFIEGTFFKRLQNNINIIFTAISIPLLGYTKRNINYTIGI